jgi:ABC-type nickel/cobalt efflux system permease component RcnA
MKKSFIILGAMLLILSLVSLTSAHNPFITKPEDQHAAPAPAIRSKLFLKILIWQHQLKEKMAVLVRQTKATGSLRPLMLLLVAAFAYGVIHAAGPGHGKAIALSYVLSQKPRWFQGILFGNSLALFHGASGIIFVLVVRLVLNQSIARNLANVTHTSQIISFSLVSCLGLWVLVKSIAKWKKIRRDESDPHVPEKRGTPYTSPILTAFVVGSIPCPAVVMVMLFALSMDLIGLGIILGLTISVGMALTVSIVVLTAMSGKAVSVSVASKHGHLVAYVECGIEIVAGLALATLGLLFLGANL